MMLNQSRTARQKNISKSMQSIINKLHHQQEKLNNLVKHYSANQESIIHPLIRNYTVDSKARNKIKSMDQKAKLKKQTISTNNTTNTGQKYVSRLPFINTKSEQVISPQPTPKFNTILPIISPDKSKDKQQFIAKSSLQRQSLSQKQFLRKRYTPNINKQHNSLKQPKTQNNINLNINTTPFRQQEQSEQGCPVPLQEYFSDFKRIVQTQVNKQIQYINQGYMNNDKKQKLLKMFQEHDREIRKLRRRCKHLQHFDVGFFTTDMFN